ncbi:MAG: DNA-directed RNA polymerase subunit K [Candidatus Micrarchaeia archaeon]
MEEEYTKFEKARIIGARALQLAYGAPPLVKVPEHMIDPLELAELEFNKGVIPITVIRRPRSAGEEPQE